MSADMDDGAERTQTIEQKLGTLSTSVAERFDTVDAALIEQRQYTEFAFDRLASEMRIGCNGVDGRFNTLERLAGEMKARFDGVDSRFNRLERKLDQFIDTQSKANELVERRLQALETGPTNL